LALSVGLSWIGACSAAAVDPFEVPLGEFSEKQRGKVASILEDVAAVVPIEAAEVRSRPEVFDFLLGEMPFTAGVVKELGRGDWDVFRDPQNPERDVFYVIDPEGYRLRFELVHRDATRRFYVSKGVFSMGILPALEGRTLVVMRAVPVGGVVRTDAMVYVRVDTGVYAKLARAAREVLERRVREKSVYFIRAAQWVAEEAARRPDWLYIQVKGSKQVDPEVLEEFHRRFLR
jgi:hypothetical protein